MTAPPPHRAATVLGGRYRLDAPVSAVAEDGSQRWRATDTVLARPVLVELVELVEVVELGPPGSATATDQGPLAATGKVVHPNIAAVYDTGSDDRWRWVVVEFPRGRPLRTLLDQHGPLSAGRATIIGRQLAAALHAAHQAGVAHGHLDLEVVMVTDDDRVKVVGFTGVGAPRDDVAAAGEVLYQLLCGHPPDPSDPCSVPASPRRLRPGVPPDLDSTVMGALGYGAAEPSSAAALAASLARVDTDADDATPDVVRDPTPPVGVVPVARRHPRRRWELPAVAVIVAVAIAALLAVLLTAGGRTKSGSPPPGQASGATVSILSAAAFDPPPGDGHEDDTNLPRLIDGNPATVWSTEFYVNRNFGNLKHGVGVALTLPHNTKVRTLVINSPSRNWTAEVYVAAQPATSLAGWGRAVSAPFTVTSAVTNVDLHGATGGVVLLWITDLGDAPAPQVRVDIGELTLLS